MTETYHGYSDPVTGDKPGREVTDDPYHPRYPADQDYYRVIGENLVELWVCRVMGENLVEKPVKDANQKNWDWLREKDVR